MPGWGEKRGPSPKERAITDTLRLGDRLYDEIQAWRKSPSTSSEQRVVDAAALYMIQRQEIDLARD